ncbi:DUF3455 domain-containing protein [Streptomyces fagopyri]|uniref:DUF3455 domain-containing protein n=1 Tax=Streptomyces fagopyri TaxID=2662397 RepID=UPI0038010414
MSQDCHRLREWCGCPRDGGRTTASVLRLNTRGGVAPAGACNPTTHPTARVPYTADYLFLATK